MKKYYLTLISFFFLSILMKAQTLDTTFGTNGKVFTSFGAFNSIFHALTMQTDGKIYAVGAKEGLFSETNGLFIAKYNSDGSLDTTYNGTGKIEVGYGFSYEFCYTAVIQPDNKLIVAGSSNGDFAIARLNSDGTYDTSFSADGKLNLSFGVGNGSKIRKILLQPDGKIIAIGEAYGGSNFDYGVARFNSDGSLDTSFGLGGKTNIPVGVANDFGNDAILQPDGKIIVIGSSKNNTGNDFFSMLRLNTDGSIDTTFGTSGKVMYRINTSECVANALTLQIDGKIIVTGNSDGDFAVLRYNTNGTLDATFAGIGHVVTDFGNSQDKIFAVSVQADGKIITAGNAYEIGFPASWQFAIARYATNGMLDTTFDTDGKMTVQMTNYESGIKDMIIQPDGKLLFGGYTSIAIGSNLNFGLLRLDNTALSINETNFGINKISLYPNPTDSEINIESPNFELNTVKISNSLGQILHEKTRHSNNVTINLSHYLSGTYFLIINENEKTKTYKIIKK